MNKPEDNHAIAQELEKQIAELEGTSTSAALQEEVERLRQQLVALRQKVARPAQDAWDRVLLARHPQRPYTLDYIQLLFTDFLELHGDRRFADDAAMVTGFAQFEDRPIVVVGTQKGRDTKQKLLRNFGMANPEGLSKGHASDGTRRPSLVCPSSVWSIPRGLIRVSGQRSAARRRPLPIT